MKDHESGDVAETESPTVGVKKQGREKNGNQDTAHQERPFIHALTATADNHHVVAITGSDKTLWVFEHDGAGNLEQLSQRYALPPFHLFQKLKTDSHPQGDAQAPLLHCSHR